MTDTLETPEAPRKSRSSKPPKVHCTKGFHSDTWLIKRSSDNEVIGTAQYVSLSGAKLSGRSGDRKEGSAYLYVTGRLVWRADTIDQVPYSLDGADWKTATCDMSNQRVFRDINGYPVQEQRSVVLDPLGAARYR